MNRKEFFKKLGLGIAGAIIAPKVIAEIPKEELPTGILEASPSMTIEEVMDIYKQTGQLMYTYAPWEYDDPLENAFHMQKDIDNRLLHG